MFVILASILLGAPEAEAGEAKAASLLFPCASLGEDLAALDKRRNELEDLIEAAALDGDLLLEAYYSNELIGVERQLMLVRMDYRACLKSFIPAGQ